MLKQLIVFISVLILVTACGPVKKDYDPLQQKTLLIDGQKISYYESDGKGTPVVLVHGNSSSALVFQKQLQSWLGKKYHLVAIDLPGHGGSDQAASRADYNLPMYAEKITRIASILHLEDAVFVGWSLGGHIVLEAERMLPRASGFVIFGTPPLAFPPAMEAAFLPGSSTGIGFKAEVSLEEANLYARDFFTPSSSIDLKRFIDDILSTDGNARAGLAASIAPDSYQDEVKVVANMTTPLAVFHGKEEQLVNIAYFSTLNMPSLWRGNIQIIEAAGHASQWERPDIFNNLLDAFIIDLKLK